MRRCLLALAMLAGVPGCATITGAVCGPVTVPIGLARRHASGGGASRVLTVPLSVLYAPVGLVMGIVVGVEADLGWLRHRRYHGIIRVYKERDGSDWCLRELPYSAAVFPLRHQLRPPEPLDPAEAAGARAEALPPEARHINGPQGTYKGYRLEKIEYPKDPHERLDWSNS